MSKFCMQKDILLVKALKRILGGVFVLTAIPGIVSAQEARSQTYSKQSLPAIVDPRPAPINNQRQQQTALTNQVAQPTSAGRTRAEKDEAVFSGYVATVTGTRLPVFGANLFRDVPSTFGPAEAQQVNADYVIGAGDELQILGWG